MSVKVASMIVSPHREMVGSSDDKIDLDLKTLPARSYPNKLAHR